MNCPNCHEFVENDATFCGNCGQLVRKEAALGAMTVKGSAPAYALANPLQHAGEKQSLMSVLLGVMGLAGSLFVPMLGLAFGLLGIVMGTTTRVPSTKKLRMAGLVISSLAIIAGLATWVYAVRNDPRFNPDVTHAAPKSQTTQSAANLSTSCYEFSFIDELNIDQGKRDCDISAYNGHTLAESTNAYKVYSSKSDITTANDFTNLAKKVINKDVSDTLDGFKIDSEKVTMFAGSPAYVLSASDKARNISVVEAAVLHEVSSGDNVFILVHANNGPTADLQIMESKWQWK